MKDWLNVRVLFWAAAAIIIALLFYGIFSSPTGIKGYLNKKNQIAIINKNIENIAKENEQLYKSIKQFKDNPESRKKMIRHQLGWIEEGERKVVFIPQQ
ncbi:MAG: septum formation initiator family protein [Thermodesulforhabdaceae bacterium]